MGGSATPIGSTGLILNSPWLDLQGSAMVRTLGTPVIDALGSRAPTSVIRLPDLGFTARTLHISLGGEWDYDLELKSRPGPPIRAGWLRAVLLGHQRVAAGLAIRRADLGAGVGDDRVRPPLARGAPRRLTRCSTWSRSRLARFASARTSPSSGSRTACTTSAVRAAGA